MAKDLKKYFSGLKAKLKKKDQLHKLKFENTSDFVFWYEGRLSEQKNKCHYCRIAEDDVNKIVSKGKLTSARFPEDGVPSRGRGRGIHFEVDRKDPQGDYSGLNCVLACYFCNNDKSDIFSEEQYSKFILNRAEFLRSLL